MRIAIDGSQLKTLVVGGVLGVSLVAAIIVYAEYGPSKWMPSIRWWGFTGATAVTFGYPLYWYRKRVRQVRFWLVFSALLVVHSAAYIVVLRSVEEWPLMLFALITPGEWVVIYPVLHRFGRA